MKNFLPVFAVFCALVLFGCSNKDEVFEPEFPTNNVGYELVYSNHKVSFYKNVLSTRASSDEIGVIELPDHPGLSIHTFANSDSNYSDYQFKAVFRRDGEDVRVVYYSSASEDGNGYLFSYDCVEGDMGSVLLSKKTTRKAAPSVADCIASAYLDDGWMSVFAWCATAVCWEVSVAIAADCVLR